tara:strand:+ start:35 stop:535 length:501 start_codon:yes stop_codon:yes gene_type:complete
MNKKTKIAILLTAIAIIGTAVGVHFYRKPKENKNVKKPFNSNKKPVNINVSFEKTSAIKNLKKSIAKGYYSMEIMCSKSGSIIVHCKTLKPVKPSLAQSLWIQMKRYANSMRKSLNQDTNNSEIKSYGENLIKNFNSTIDTKFNPKYYNPNTYWYKEYLSQGGGGI